MSEVTVVGIDLGTTNSVVGTVVDGREKLFADKSGADLMPSVVGMDGSRSLVVGRAAKNRRVIDPDGTVVSIKRLMGKDVKVRVGDQQLSPPQVSALILGALLDRVQEQHGVRPARAIITVPAWFDETQREATRTAGELAGLQVERLVNEPTAAAVHYQTGGEAMVLVYDFGGGTFDVSILERDEGFLEVRASRGDTQLGGDDIDKALCDFVLSRLGDARARVESDKHAMTRLVEAVERAKIALSDREEIKLFDPFLAGEGSDAVHLDLPLTRDDVEGAARPFVEKTLRCIDDALRDARLDAARLDRVLLVGGTSKMPLVSSMVADHLGRPVIVDPEADRAVALGAALLAGRAAGADVQEVLVDITPHTLAIGALGSDPDAVDDEELDAVPVIPRDTVVPVERSQTFFTAIDDQTSIMAPVVQGEEELVGDNTWLGTVRVEDLPPSPIHSPVEVVFQLDLSGVLHVRAKHLPSGKDATVVIANSPYRLTAQKRQAAREQVEALRAAITAQAAEAQVCDADLSLANAMIARARKALATTSSSDPEARRRASETLDALVEAIENRSASIPEQTDALSDALLDLM